MLKEYTILDFMEKVYLIYNLKKGFLIINYENQITEDNYVEEKKNETFAMSVSFSDFLLLYSARFRLTSRASYYFIHGVILIKYFQ